jgi:hypothetical protein
MDDADRADEQQEEIMRRKLAYLSSQTNEAEATGRCLNCDAKVPKGHRWCDHDCMKDWEKRK